MASPPNEERDFLISAMRCPRNSPAYLNRSPVSLLLPLHPSSSPLPTALSAAGLTETRLFFPLFRSFFLCFFRFLKNVAPCCYPGESGQSGRRERGKRCEQSREEDTWLDLASGAYRHLLDLPFVVSTYTLQSV